MRQRGKASKEHSFLAIELRSCSEVYSSNFGVPYAPLLPKDIRRLQPKEVAVVQVSGS